MADHDVAIVGGGPVGLLLATLLADRNLDVGVYDARDGNAESDSFRAIAIHPPGLAALEAAGVADRIQAEALNITGGALRSEGRELASLDLDDPVLTLPQHRTEAILRERLNELQPGALRSGRRVLDVETSGRLAVAADGITREVTARIVVGADGVRSTVRSELGAAWNTVRGTAQYRMFDVRDDERSDDAARAEIFCEPAGIVATFPLPDDFRRWVVFEQRANGAPSGSVPDESMLANAIAETVFLRTGRVVNLNGAKSTTMFTAKQRLAEPMFQDRTVLVGDAAHEVSPVGGQGMNLGWIGAVRLRAAILYELRNDNRVQHPDRAPTFEAYEKLTRRSAGIAMGRARRLMHMGFPITGAKLSARNAAIRVLGKTPGALARVFTMQGL